MSKNNLNIEELFQESYKDYRLNPSTNVWNKINKQLQVKEFFRFNLAKVNVYYAIVVLTLFVGAIFYSNNNINKNKAQKISKLENITLTTKKTYKNKLNNNKIKNLIIKENIIISKEQKIEKIKKATPLNKLKSLKALSIIYGDSLKKLELIVHKQPQASFSIASKSGCVPFNLNITNNTKNAFEYTWNFGDGKKYKSKNPSHTYKHPGLYKISLTVKGYGGVSYCIIDSIIVHDNPKAKVFWPYSMPLFINQKIIIPNESQNAVKYEWNFGDNTISNDKLGTHSFNKEGNYLITLKTWNKNNCYDSTIVKKVKVININNQIKFPNAFTPNPNGSSSGHYSNTDYNNDIFHPICNIEVSKYNLKIFNREGILIFESNDINIGWDGYFNNKKLPETVYLYVASGIFENKQKFLKKGNITIINK